MLPKRSLYGLLLACRPVRVVARYLVISGAILGLVAVTATAGAASGLRHSSSRVRAYSTPPTAPLVTALADPLLFNSRQEGAAFTMAQAAGATYVRLQVDWRSIAPATPPAGFVATDPTSSGYSWSGIDGIVKAAEAAGLTPILDIVDTPSWAFAKRPSGLNAGTPKAGDLGAFAGAMATHFQSTQGFSAHVYQVWNEPNLSTELSPVSGSAYRGMVNAVANAVHAVDPANIVVAGGLEPVGHKKGNLTGKKVKWYSVAPLAFMRSFLCLSKGAHPHTTCRNVAHFDVWSHHPYTHGGPFGRAKISDDIELGDLPRMRALLRAGIRLHHVVSAHPVKFWVTEFSWDTNPPRPHAASLSLAARWTAESLHQMWLSGVSLVTWFLLQDYATPSPFASGLYFHTPSLGAARAKPTLTAFRFPFVAYLGKGTVSIWGRDATSDKEDVTIQFRRGRSGKWRTVATVGSNGSGIFRATLRLKATKKDWLRAKAVGSGTSLAFSLTRPKDPNIGPWG
jgi:hypothetical protein